MDSMVSSAVVCEVDRRCMGNVGRASGLGPGWSGRPESNEHVGVDETGEVMMLRDAELTCTSQGKGCSCGCLQHLHGLRHTRKASHSHASINAPPITTAAS